MCNKLGWISFVFHNPMKFLSRHNVKIFAKIAIFACFFKIISTQSIHPYPALLIRLTVNNQESSPPRGQISLRTSPQSYSRSSFRLTIRGTLCQRLLNHRPESINTSDTYSTILKNLSSTFNY